MGVFKLGKMTLGSLFKEPETIQYPLVEKPKPAGLKGHIVIDVDLCILCGLCERSCTTGCLKVDKASRIWQIQPYQCVQCGYCVQVCPKKCLLMEPTYWAAATAKGLVSFEVPAREKVPVHMEQAARNVAGGAEAKLAEQLAAMDPEKAEKVRAAMAKKGAAADDAVDARSSVERAPMEAQNAKQDNVSREQSMHDEELEAKLAMMDAERARKAREAFEGNR